MNPVAVADLIVRWKPLNSQEEATAQAYIDDAWEELLVKVPTIADRLTSSELRPGLVVKTVVAAVKAVMLNPEMLNAENLGEYGYSRTTAATALQFFTDADIALLAPVVAAGAGAFDIAPSYDVA